MNTYTFTHLADGLLLNELHSHCAHERRVTAVVLAQIAEVERRGLHVRWASSLRDYCIEVLHFSEDAAYKRIQAARAGRDFPALFEAVASGRLHLSGSACSHRI